MRDDTGDAYVLGPASDEWVDDIDALERSLNHLSCMLGEPPNAEMTSSPAEMPTVVLEQLAEAA
jgi:hypothetical protein